MWARAEPHRRVISIIAAGALAGVTLAFTSHGGDLHPDLAKLQADPEVTNLRMHYRLCSIGGDVSVRSEPGAGISVIGRIPT